MRARGVGKGRGGGGSADDVSDVLRAEGCAMASERQKEARSGAARGKPPRSSLRAHKPGCSPFPPPTHPHTKSLHSTHCAKDRAGHGCGVFFLSFPLGGGGQGGRGGGQRGKQDAPPAAGLSHKHARTHLIDEQLGAGEADAAQHLDEVVDEPVVIHGLGQLQVAKVPGGVRGTHPIRLALHRPVHRPHPRVAQTPSLGPTLVVRLRRLNLAHRHLPLQWFVRVSCIGRGAGERGSREGCQRLRGRSHARGPPTLRFLFYFLAR